MKQLERRTIILELTTSKVKFSTQTKLIIGSKVYFYLKDKKFIVNIRQVDATPSKAKDGTSVIQFEVHAEYEIVLSGEIKVKIENPHYLIK